jgi:hypothetical protein
VKKEGKPLRNCPTCHSPRIGWCSKEGGWWCDDCHGNAEDREGWSQEELDYGRSAGREGGSVTVTYINSLRMEIPSGGSLVIAASLVPHCAPSYFVMDADEKSIQDDWFVPSRAWVDTHPRVAGRERAA